MSSRVALVSPCWLAGAHVWGLTNILHMTLVIVHLGLAPSREESGFASALCFLLAFCWHRLSQVGEMTDMALSGYQDHHRMKNGFSSPGVNLPRWLVEDTFFYVKMNTDIRRRKQYSHEFFSEMGNWLQRHFSSLMLLRMPWVPRAMFPFSPMTAGKYGWQSLESPRKESFAGGQGREVHRDAQMSN